MAARREQSEIASFAVPKRHALSSAKNNFALSLSLLLLPMQVLLPGSAAAQGIPIGGRSVSSPAVANSSAPTSSLRAHQPINLDLSATQPTVSAAKSGTVLIGGNLAGNGLITGATSLSVMVGQMLTPAENMALWQSLNGSQHLLLNSAGSATGGTAVLGSSWGANLSSLVVPAGVTLNAIGFTSNSPLSVSGLSTIVGSVYALQHNAGMTASLNFGNNLNISSGGLLSGYLPVSLPGISLSNLYASQHMALNVAGNFSNNGTLTVPGNLNINVGGTFNNATVPGITSSAAAISALNINVLTGSGNIINTGLISALDSISLGTAKAAALNIDNTGGIIHAANALHITNDAYASLAQLDTKLTLKPTVTETGGLLQAERITIEAPSAAVKVNADQIDGGLSINAGTAAVSASSGDLNLVDINLSGDPIFYLAGGGTLTLGSFTSATPSDYVALSFGAIDSTPGTTINTSGGNVWLWAGYGDTSYGGGNGTANNGDPCTNCAGHFTNGVNTAWGSTVKLNGVSVNTTNPSGGNAGSLTIKGQTISMTNSTLDTSATGAGNAGDMSILAFNGITGQNLTINANGGAVSGNGGSINIDTGTHGTGGSVALAGTNINANSTYGNAGSILVYCTIIQNATLDVGGNISASASNFGNGGTINLQYPQSRLPFLIGGDSTNGVSGNISANAGVDGGNGGSITIYTYGGGGLTLDSTSRISLYAPEGSGGRLTLGCNGGVMTIPHGYFDVSGGNGGGGFLQMTANQFNIINGGWLTIYSIGSNGSPGNVNVIPVAEPVATPVVYGAVPGGVVLSTSLGPSPARPIVLSLDLTDPTTVSKLVGLQLSNPSHFGGTLLTTNGIATGGNLIISSSDDLSRLTAENVPSGVILTFKDFQPSTPININLNAASHSPSVIVNGTNQFLSSSGVSNASLNITSNLTAPALIVGGQLSSDGSLTILAGGNVNVTGSVKAASGNLTIGTSTGTNGSILNSGSISSTGTTTLSTDGSGSIIQTAGTLSGTAVALKSMVGDINLANSIAGTNAFSASSAGNIFLAAIQAKSVNILSTTGTVNLSGNIDVSGASIDGSGGQVTLQAKELNFSGGANQLVSANATGNGTGGAITVSASTVGIAADTSLLLTANASGNGSGGSVSVSASDPTRGNITIANCLSAMSISATGGSPNSQSGNGGKVTLFAANNLSVDLGAISANPLGSNGNGAVYQFSAGTAGAGNLTVSGASLNVDGVGTGSGGRISLQANTSSTLSLCTAEPGEEEENDSDSDDGTVSANAGASSGTGGIVSISNQGSGGIAIKTFGLSADSNNGTAGTISILAGSGNLQLAASSVSSSALNSGDGGAVTISAAVLATQSGTNLAISTNGSGTGNGGTVTLSTTGSAQGRIVIGNSPGEISISATGGSPNSSAGDAGSVSISSANCLSIDANALTVKPLGINGNGAFIALNVPTPISDSLSIKDSLDTNGIGTGYNGLLIINQSINVPSLDLTDSKVVSSFIHLQNAFPSLFSGSLLSANGGVATGGNLTLNSFADLSNLSALNIPSGVTLTLKDFSVNNPVNVNLTQASHSSTVIVSGTEQFVSSTGVSNAVIRISTNQSVAALRVSGQMSSDGSLSLSAAGDISVAGSLSAASGNLSLSTAPASAGNITISGSVSSSAVTAISVGGTGNISQTSGNLSGSSVDLYSANGKITVVNNLAGTGAFSAEASGSISLAGVQGNSISIQSATGSVYLNGNLDSKGNISIVSGADIMGNAEVQSISAVAANGQGCGITMVAGAKLSLDGLGISTIDPNHSNGGNIDFSASSNLLIDTSAKSGNFSGGNITLAAFANGSLGGTIVLPATSVINSSGSNAGNNANVTLIAGANNGTGITTGQINTSTGSGNSPGTGMVILTTAQATSSDGLAVSFGTTGSIVSSNYLMASSTIQNAGITFKGSISSLNGINISAGGDINGVPVLSDPVGFSVGKTPIRLVLNPDNTRLYVLNESDNTMDVVDTSNNKILAVVPFDTQGVLSDIALSPDGRTAYITVDISYTTLMVVDLSTNSVKAVIPASTVQERLGVAINPAGTIAYVPNYANFEPSLSTTMSVVDLRTNTIMGTVTGLSDPQSVIFNQSGSLAYVSNTANNTVSVVNTSSNTVIANFPAGSAPVGLALNPSGSTLYVTNANAGTVTAINTSNNTVIATIPVGNTPVTVAVNPAGTYAYVTNEFGNNISVINTSSNKVESTIPSVSTPVGMVLNNAGTIAYVADANSNKVDVIALGPIAAQNQISTPSTLTSPGTILLSSLHGNIGSSLTPISTAAGALAINALGSNSNAFINQSHDVGLLGSSVSGLLNLNSTGAVTVNALNNVSSGSLSITAGGNIQILGSLTTTSADMSLSSTATVAVSGALSSAGSLSASASGFNTSQGTTVSATSILINGLSSSNLSIGNAGLMTATSGNITASSGTGYDLVVNGGGLMSATGTIFLGAATSSSGSKILFTGSQKFAAPTVLSAQDPSQSIVAQTGTIVNGLDSLTLKTNFLDEQGTAQVIGHPLIFKGSGLGTIANSTGSIDLKNVPNLQFIGESLTILAEGSIVNTGSSRTIDLSSSHAAGGSLTLVAGYNFTPGASVASAAPPDSEQFNILGAVPGSSSIISLGNVSINTSSTKAAGNVLAVATGSVTLGNVNVSADLLSGTAGTVNVIGHGITISGTVNASGNVGGTVSLNSATPAIVGGSVIIEGGALASGNFAAGVLSGDITVNAAINAGNGNIILATGASGAIRQGGNAPLSAGLLSVIAGSQDFNLNISAANLTINTSSASATINSNTLLNINSSAVGGNLSVSSSNGLNVGAGQIITAGGKLSLANSGANSNLAFSDGSTVTAGTLSASGIAKINQVPVAGLVTADVLKAGAISLRSSGALGQNAVSFGSNVQLNANGGDITLYNLALNSNINAGDQLSLSANGGSINIYNYGGSINLGIPSGALSTALTARSMNTFIGGNINISGSNGISFGGGLQLNAFGSMFLNASNGEISVASSSGSVINVAAYSNILASTGLSIGSNTSLNSGNSISAVVFGQSSQITLGDNVTIRAGALNAGASLLSTDSLRNSDLISNGSVSITAVGTGGISGTSHDSILAEGGGLFLNAVGLGANLVLGDSANLRADGGGINIFSAGSFNVGAAGVAASGSLVTRAVGPVAGSVIVTSFNGLAIGDNTQNVIAGSLILTNIGTASPGALSFGANSSTLINGNGSAIINQIGQSSKLAFGSGAVLQAQGFMSLLALGAYAGKTIDIGTGFRLESTNSGINVSSIGNGAFVVDDSSKVLADNGGINIFSTGAISLGTTGKITMSTGGLGGFMGIVAANGLSVGANSLISSSSGMNILGLGTVGAMSFGDNTQVTGAQFTNIQNLSNTGFSTGNNVHFTATGGLNLTQLGSGSFAFGPNTSILVNNGGLNLLTLSAANFGAGSTVNAPANFANVNLQAFTGVNTGLGSSISAAAGNVNINNIGVGKLQVSDGSTIVGGSGVNLAAFNPTSDIEIGNSVTITAGSLKAVPAPPVYPNPLQFSSVNQSGSISISAFGSELVGLNNTGLSVGAGSNFTSNGSNITLNSLSQIGQVLVGDNYKFTANGGSISVASGASGAGALTVGAAGGAAGSSMTAQALGFAPSTIALVAQGNVLVGAGVLNSGTATSITSLFGSTTVSGTAIAALSNVSITGSTIVTVDTGANLKAGSLSAGAPATGNLTPDFIASTGSLVLSGAQITIGNNDSLSSNGNDLKITANSQTMNIGASNLFEANGGNVQMLAKGVVTAQSGNTFHARSVGTVALPFASTGGGIELGSGLTSSTNLITAFTKPPGTSPLAPNVLGQNVVYTGNSLGVIHQNVSSTGIINLNSTNANPSTLILNTGGVQVFDAQGTGAAVNVDNGSFKTEGLRPIALLTPVEPDQESLATLPMSIKRTGTTSDIVVGKHAAQLRVFGIDGHAAIVPVEDSPVQFGKQIAQIYANPKTQFRHSADGVLQLYSGEVFLNALNTIPVKTDDVEVLAMKGALASVRAEDGCTYIRVCSPSGTVSAVVSGKTITLNSGEEMVVTDHKPDQSEIYPTDGLGRRHTHTLAYGSKYVTISDFSIISMVSNHESLFALHNSSSGSERRLLDRLLKTAATVDVVLKYRGAYSSR